MKSRCIIIIATLITTALIIVGIIVVFATEMISTIAIENHLNKVISSETEDKPIIAIGTTVYVDEKGFDIREILLKNSKDSDFGEFFCVNEKQIYFSFSNVSENAWFIASVAMDDQKFIVHEQVQDRQRPYFGTTDSQTCFSERDGFYYDGIIALNCETYVYVYDIHTQSTYSYDSNQYEYPEIQEICKIENECVKILTDSLETSYTLSDMRKHSKSISLLCDEFENKKTWEGDPCISNHFFQKTQAVNGEIFAIGECLNYWGHSYAIILKYDKVTTEWSYSSVYYTGDDPGLRCSIIPEFSS